MTPDEALSLIRRKEGQTVEFKESFAEENKAIRSLCAFANAEGGSVVFGVRNDGTIIGASVGANTLENFSNKFRAHTHPTLHPSVDEVTLDEAKIVVATVPKPRPGELFFAFDRALIRVGKSNQPMSAQEQKARLVGAEPDWSEETDRPRFAVTQSGVTQLETEFQPHFNVKQFSGDPVASLKWRIRGPRFAMDWRMASGATLARTHFVEKFDLSQPPHADDNVGLNEMGFEIRFPWRGSWRSEIHRWPVERRQFTAKVLWEVGAELLPPIESNDPHEEAE